VDDAPPDWQRATRKGGAVLVLLEDNPADASHGIPVWAGLVIRRRRTKSDQVELTLITLEGYLDRVYVGDQTFTGVGQNTMLQTLINTYVKTGVKNGLQIIGGGAGTLRDKSWLDVDDKTIYSCVQDMAGIIGGPEWTIGMEWTFGPDRLTPVFYVGDRIGTAATAGLSPSAVFDMPGNLDDFTELEDFGSGKGATDVMAVSSGEGTTRPQSAHQVSTDTTRPRFEHRFTPSTSITNTTTLDQHAQKALPVMQDGSIALSLIAQLENAPKLGIDWNLGDDVAYQLGGLDEHGRETVPSIPGGISGVSRAVGWERTFGPAPTLTPIILAPTGVLDG